MEYLSFLEHLRRRYGRNWVVHRRTPRIVARYGGDDVVCLSPKAYAEEQDKWADGHPAWLLTCNLPEGEEKEFIQAAVRARLT